MNSSLLRGAPRVLGAAALLTALFTFPAAAATIEAPAGACTGDDGVTVVVDFTDLGGEVEVACAPGTPESGRAALEAAGFVPEDSMPGMICAINSSPDPCPEEFDGNFWSYWFAGEDGAWETYLTGADEATPAPGSVDGWRYFDGSAGPAITPAELTAAGDAGDAEAQPEDETEDTADAEDVADAATAEDGAADDDDAPAEDGALSGTSRTVVGIVAGVAILGALIAMIVRRNRQAN